jgi:hypothetical protein
MAPAPRSSPRITRSSNTRNDKVGEKVGRIYCTYAVGRGHTWNWTVYGIAVIALER